jgi:hydroxypyruvate isomerase
MRQLPDVTGDNMPDSGTDLSRRTFFETSLTAVAGSALTRDLSTHAGDVVSATSLKGRLKQSVCRWCYDKIPLDDLCKAAADIGLKSVELLGEQEWSVPKQYGLICAMANGPSTIRVGFNRLQEHDRLVAESERLLHLIAREGYPNMIVFSGNRGGMSDGEGLENCVRGLQRITPVAERLGVTVCMELLNSKVDHIDYMCDRTPWGVELVKRVGSPRFKLLYDIYHMQIMEGDVIRTIRDNRASIAHFHTGGVPGRAEIDETQELFYPQIARAILETGFTGYLAQEFVPIRDPLVSLHQGASICDV